MSTSEFASLSRAKLRAMLMAGAGVLECHHVLRNGGVNLVNKVLRGQGTFYEYDHYPADDVYDQETGVHSLTTPGCCQYASTIESSVFSQTPLP